jgi:hypothetical protein
MPDGNEMPASAPSIENENANSSSRGQPRSYGQSESDTWRRLARDAGEAFPRGRGLSFHSTMFWVQNKDRFLRQLLIRDIEAITGRRLCVFFCSPYFPTSITDHDVDRLHEIIREDGGGPFDLLLETEGGSTDATEALIKIIRAVNRDFRVIVPGRAKSSGTMICLASVGIVMGTTSQLGPIEPFVGDLPASLCMTSSYENDSPALFHEASHVLRQTCRFADALLNEWMIPDGVKRAETIQKLTGRTHFPSHGYMIDHSEAQALGLGVDVRPEDCFLWERCRLLHALYKEDSNRKGIAKIFEGRERSLEYLGNGRQEND